MVAIIDYGLGNLASVQKALNFIGINNVISDDPGVIRSASGIILPGVGSFEQGMKNLAEKGLIDVLSEEVLVKKKKFLGICLGMQLIVTDGNEPGPVKGLGWIEGEVKKLTVDLRIPHLGWNETAFRQDLAEELDTAAADNNFYYIHSYHFVPADPDVIVATTFYGSEIVAGVRKDNILAFQFHPEKSHMAGLSLLKNYFGE